MRFAERVCRGFCFCDENGHHTYDDCVSYVLNSKLHIGARKFSYRYFVSEDKQSVLSSFITDFMPEGKSFDFNYYCFSIAETINENFYKRLARLRSRVRDMVSYCGDLSFVTLTFCDDVLQSTSAETRRRYVSRWFREFGGHYVANIDFGAEKGREHYHGIVDALPDTSPYAKYNGRECYGFQIDAPIINKWEYGIYDAEIIRYTDDDVKRLTTYINKLSNHALKETTKGKRIIYDRIPFPNKSLKKLSEKRFLQEHIDLSLRDELDLFLNPNIPSAYLCDIDTSSSVILSLDALRKVKNL